MAAAKSFGSVEETNFTLMPKVGKVTSFRGRQVRRVYIETINSDGRMVLLAFELVETLGSKED